MRVFSNTCTFDYSWEEVSAANWVKYCPWNDKSTHVIAVDTLSRHVDASTGIVRIPLIRSRTSTDSLQLRTERLITCKQSAPAWLAKLMGGNDVSHVFETSYVDPVTKKVTMCSTNMTFSNIINVQETVVYRPHSTPGVTTFNQEAQITAVCGGWQKIKNAVEEASVDAFRKNAAKGKEGFETVLEHFREAFGTERERVKMMAA